MKKIIPLLAVIFLAGCTSSNTTVSTNNADENTEETTAYAYTDDTSSNDVSILSDLWAEIKDNSELGETSAVSPENIYNRYGIDTNEIDGYIFEEPSGDTNVDTVIVIKCGSNDQTNDIKDKLQTMLDNAKETTENYNPEQFKLYDKSILEINGNYVYWIVSENPDEIVEIINNNIN